MPFLCIPILHDVTYVKLMRVNLFLYFFLAFSQVAFLFLYSQAHSQLTATWPVMDDSVPSASHMYKCMTFACK